MAIRKFDSIIGQEAAVRHLQNAVRTEQVSQAYIICGERGSGKMELAETFAAVLQCSARTISDGLTEPCGECHSCVQMESGNHPDVITVTNASVGVERKTDTIVVDAARFIQQDIAIKPYEGPYKIYIIPDAQKMNQQAQNALLKTLEEPPSYAVILLLADETSSFLSTVLSRCVILRLRPVSEQELTSAMVKEGYPEDRAETAARLSHGNPGRCRELLQDENLTGFRTELISFLKRMPDVTSYDIVQLAGQLSPGKEKKESEKVDDFFDFTESWFRDLLVFKSTRDVNSLIFRDEVTYISNTADLLSYKAMEKVQNAMDEALRQHRANGNDAQILEILLLKIRGAFINGRA